MGMRPKDAHRARGWGGGAGGGGGGWGGVRKRGRDQLGRAGRSPKTSPWIWGWVQVWVQEGERCKAVESDLGEKKKDIFMDSPFSGADSWSGSEGGLGEAPPPAGSVPECPMGTGQPRGPCPLQPRREVLGTIWSCQRALAVPFRSRGGGCRQPRPPPGSRGRR